jgi:cold shock CspA family protein
MERGTVTAMSSEGFGFIASDRHAGEIWIRPRSYDGRTPPYEGQRVEYTLAVGSLGVEAANVRPLEERLDGLTPRAT